MSDNDLTTTTTDNGHEEDPNDGDSKACHCEKTQTVYSLTPLPSGVTERTRHQIVIESKSWCDPTTPNRCFYEYIATAQPQRFNAHQQQWVDLPRHDTNIHLFAIGDPVNYFVTNDRVDENTARVGRDAPKAPRVQDVEVTLEISASPRSGHRVTLSRKLELCVPAGDTPRCPDKDEE